MARPQEDSQQSWSVKSRSFKPSTSAGPTQGHVTGKFSGLCSVKACKAGSRHSLFCRFCGCVHRRLTVSSLLLLWNSQMAFRYMVTWVSFGLARAEELFPTLSSQWFAGRHWGQNLEKLSQKCMVTTAWLVAFLLRNAASASRVEKDQRALTSLDDLM